MRRFLFGLVIFTAAILILRRLAGMLAPRQPSAAGRRSAEPRRTATELVRDRVCNTYVPRDSALQLTPSGETLFFCSEECRGRFLASSARGIDAA